MKHTCSWWIGWVILLACAAWPAWAADPKAPSKPATPAKPSGEPPAPDAIPTHQVKRELFKIDLVLRGVFEPENAIEIALRPEVWTQLEVVKAVEHGRSVKKGDPILQCDLQKIDDEIAELRSKLAISELTLKQAEENLKLAEATTPLDLQLIERNRRNAADDLSRFYQVDRAMLEKIAQFQVKSAENALEYEQEELRQLEKMYKADDLTEETEEIVLKRQRNAVEAAAFMLERARVSRDETFRFDLPRRKESLEHNNQRQEILAARAKITLPAALEQQRRELAKLKLDRAKDEQRLKRLLADREMLTVRAPADGVVYYGRFVRGKWSGMDVVSESLRRGGQVTKNTVLMTIVAPRPLFVRAGVAEADLEKVRLGLKGILRPAAFPDLKLPATIARLDPVPAAPESFEVRIDVQLDVADRRAALLVPGMVGTAKFTPYLDKRALVVPAKAVLAEELDEDSRYIFVMGKEGKPEKRPVVVGKRAEDRIEIVRGLSEGEQVLLERPAATELPAKPAEKPKPKEKQPPAEKPKTAQPAK